MDGRDCGCVVAPPAGRDDDDDDDEDDEAAAALAAARLRVMGGMAMSGASTGDDVRLPSRSVFTWPGPEPERSLGRKVVVVVGDSGLLFRGRRVERGRGEGLVSARPESSLSSLVCCSRFCLAGGIKGGNLGGKERSAKLGPGECSSREPGRANRPGKPAGGGGGEEKMDPGPCRNRCEAIGDGSSEGWGSGRGRAGTWRRRRRAARGRWYCGATAAALGPAAGGDARSNLSEKTKASEKGESSQGESDRREGAGARVGSRSIGRLEVVVVCVVVEVVMAVRWSRNPGLLWRIASVPGTVPGQGARVV